jgi:peptide/nickel transport system substrate-binding protein
VIHLKEPNVVLLDVMKAPIFPFMILPASQKDKPARGIDVIGTGPFSLGEWVKDSHLVLNRFDNYTADIASAGRDGYAGRKTAYLDSVRFRFMPEATTRIAALQTDEVQLASSIRRSFADKSRAGRSCRFTKYFRSAERTSL